MNNKLIDISIIQDLLGYSDVRSVEKWCRQNKIPIFLVGKRKYTIENFLEIFLEKELKVFINANYTNPEEIFGAVTNDDKAKLIELIDAPVSNKVVTKYKDKKKRSSAAEAFLNKVNSKVA